jgi:Tol biopolymer transport system component
LTWIARNGKPLSRVGNPGDYWDLRLSPDERQVAVLNHNSADGGFWLEILDLERNLHTIFSEKESRSYGPTWSRDGRQLYFTSLGSGQDRRFHLFSKPIGGTGLGQSLSAYTERYVPHDLSPDGATLVGDREVLNGLRQTGSALVTAPLTSLAWTERLPVSPINTLAQFSPDGKWLAYQSTISGRSEVYLTDFPGLGSNRQISLAGGAQPRWSAGSKELFYLAPDATVWSAGAPSSPNSRIQHPIKLLQAPVANTSSFFQYDVTRDGQRFLIVNTKPDGDSQYIHVVIGWPELVRQAQGR